MKNKINRFKVFVEYYNHMPDFIHYYIFKDNINHTIYKTFFKCKMVKFIMDLYKHRFIYENEYIDIMINFAKYNGGN